MSPLSLQAKRPRPKNERHAVNVDYPAKSVKNPHLLVTVIKKNTVQIVVADNASGTFFYVMRDDAGKFPAVDHVGSDTKKPYALYCGIVRCGSNLLTIIFPIPGHKIFLPIHKLFLIENIID
jgi:hypothetical protein